MKYILLYIGTFIAFLLIDLIWLGVISRGLYRDQIGHLMADNVKWIAVFIFYFLFVGGILIFGVIPGAQEDNIVKTLLLGGLFGMIAYATYDLTNLATLRDWPVKIVIIDIAWGTILSTLVSLAGFYLYKFIFT